MANYKGDNFGQLDSDEIERLFRQIEGDNTNEIENIISKEIKAQNSIGGILAGAGFGALFEGLFFGVRTASNVESKKEALYSACRTAIYDKREEIRKIMKDNTKTTNYILEIVQLIAPAVAQVYLGMSGLAIVGAITILCKQGIQQMIE